MTISTSPAAEANPLVGESVNVEAKASVIIERITSTLIPLYEKQVNAIKTIDAQPIKHNTDTPWKEYFENNVNGLFDFLYVEPVSKIYTDEDSDLFLENFTPGRNYKNIFSNHLIELSSGGGFLQLITGAVEDFKNSNITGYQDKIERAKTIIDNTFKVEVNTANGVAKHVTQELNNPQSIIYKPGSSFGPFTNSEIESFDIYLDDYISTATNIESVLVDIFDLLDEISYLSESVGTRVSIENSTEDSPDPNDPTVSNEAPQVELQLPEDKDPWGIRFSYSSSSGIESDAVDINKDFYFQLLPAIKTNMPSSGSTDVPGAMPGIQFRIENNIVKHKIPGFSPIYQPIGIDCIKCSLVGTFTGNDGLDLSRPNSLRAGLLRNGESALSNKYGPFQETIYSLYDSTKGARAIGGRAPGTLGDLPSVRDNSSSSAATIPVLSEDAFRSAQDFYNEIVSQGREVEVELNLRKGSGPFPGGNAGPFRDPDTGNPKFKALIKRLDLYYARRDRCWFILDLEITDSGLIGKECINLTNVIDESLDLFESVESVQELTRSQLFNCMLRPYEIKLAKDKSGQIMVIDLDTGISYFYYEASGNLVEDVYPWSVSQTLKYLGQNTSNGLLKNPPGPNTLSNEDKILRLMLEIASIYKPNPSDRENDLSANWLPHNGINATWLGTAWRYDKNLGKFIYSYDRTGFPVRDAVTTVNRARTLSELLNNNMIMFSDRGSTRKIVNFVLSDYLPLLNIPDHQTRCRNESLGLLGSENEEVTEEETGRTTNSENENENENENFIRQTPEPTKDVSTPDNDTLQPTYIFDPVEEGNFIQRALDERDQRKEIKEAVNNGSLDQLLSQAVQEFFTLLKSDPNQIINPTALSPGLVELTRHDVENDLIKVEREIPTFNIVTGRTRYLRSNREELTVTAKFKPTSNFTYQVGIHENSIRERLYYDISFGIKAFLKNGIKEYKVIGLNFTNTVRNDRDLDGQIDQEINADIFFRSDVTIAPPDREPSANNPRSISN